jgi:hypothetical protein
VSVTLGSWVQDHRVLHPSAPNGGSSCSMHHRLVHLGLGHPERCMGTARYCRISHGHTKLSTFPCLFAVCIFFGEFQFFKTV